MDFTESLEISIRNETFELHASKAVFWKTQSCLILSDLHIGKAAHFRKNGIPISQKVTENDVEKLKKLFQYYKPQKLILLGDVYHSTENSEWKLLDDFLCNINSTIIFVEGNHDRFLQKNKVKFNAEFCKTYQMSDFVFSHDKIEPSENFVFSGHIHPSYVLRGKGKQNLRLPCFWQTENSMVVPAFSDFTGSFNISPNKRDKVYVVGANSVKELIID